MTTAPACTERPVWRVTGARTVSAVHPLRHLRHGPLLFWIAAVVAMGSICVAALGRSTPSPSTPVAALSPAAELTAVDGWRASLAQLPVTIAGGSHQSFARDLAAVALAAAERTGDPELAAAWQDAARAATALAAAEPDDVDTLYAQMHGVALAGDRLAVTASGGTWIAAPRPESIPVGPLPAFPPVDPGGMRPAPAAPFGG
jgi:hypothetical protein